MNLSNLSYAELERLAYSSDNELAQALCRLIEEAKDTLEQIPEEFEEYTESSSRDVEWVKGIFGMENNW